MYIKYFLEFNSIFKKYKIVVLACFFAFPLIFSQLYELRNKLRNQADSEVSSDLIFGVLAGRLSSFSDAALILQEAPYFVLSSQQLDPFYFQKQALGGVLSMNFMPEVRPETMLFKFYNEKSDDNVTYMAGTQGNLYISLFHSIPTFIFNFITIVLYVFITFYLFRLLRFNFSTELAFLLLLYVIMSGVSNEFAFLVFSVFVYLVLFLLVNLFKTI
jgi:small-conductance mechanosensitive channel